MQPSLTELLAVLTPSGSLTGALLVFVASPRRGRALVDDILRGAGVGGLIGGYFALLVAATQALGSLPAGA